MIVAAAQAQSSSLIQNSLAAHRSALLTRSEVLHSTTVLFLATTQHERWARELVGDEAIEKAISEKRLRLINPSGEDIPDPYFGDEKLYREVCEIILAETPRSLDVALSQMEVKAS